MDELTRALQIRQFAQDIIDDPANGPKAVSRAHAIQGLAEGIDESEHSKVRGVLSMRSFSAGVPAAIEEKMADAENNDAPKPENKAGKKSENKATPPK